MSDTTPQSPNPEQGDGAAKTPAPRKKAPVRKTTAKPAPASNQPASNAGPTSPAQAEAAGNPDVVATPDPEPAAASAGQRDGTTGSTPATTAPIPTTHGSSRSVLDGVRDNPVGPLFAGLLVALAVGLLLSVLVPDEPSALAMIILGVLVAASVGFTVRLLSSARGLRNQVDAFLAAVVGVHVMAITGTVGGDIPVLSELGASGPGFNEALLIALATPAASAGTLLAGLTAAIIVGWSRNRVQH